ncbi:Translation initiation factor 2 [uncultured Candidatus Thioglobus sp.]|nr:Translation initiation factor 2 [uncultured Candidatus Thioglobus sp.]
MTHTVKTLSKLLKKTPNEMVTILANANIKGKSLESDISAKERKILMSSLSGHSCNKSSVMISHKSSAKTSTKSDSIKVKKLETKKVVDEKPACKVNESEQVKIVESKIMAISEEIESDNSRLAEYEQDIKDAKDFENKLKDCQEIKGCLRAVHEECEVFFSDRVIASEVNKGKPKKIIDARKKDIKLVNSKIKAKNKRIKILDNTNNIKEVMLDGNNIFNESEELLEKLGAINIRVLTS